MHSGLNLRFLRPADWWTLRQVRLAALRDSPHAFTSHYGHERQWAETEWRRTLKSSTWIVAQTAGEVAGLARSVREPRIPKARNLESIWVAPIYRHQGVCRDLVLALADRERRMGATDLLLWVLDGNHDALRAYEALGFQPTGRAPVFAGVRAMGAAAGSEDQLLNAPYANRWFAQARPWYKFSAAEIHRLQRAPDVVFGV